MPKLKYRGILSNALSDYLGKLCNICSIQGTFTLKLSYNIARDQWLKKSAADCASTLYEKNPGRFQVLLFQHSHKLLHQVASDLQILGECRVLMGVVDLGAHHKFDDIAFQ